MLLVVFTLVFCPHHHTMTWLVTYPLICRSVVQVGLDGPAELIFEQDVGWLVELEMLLKRLHLRFRPND